MEKPPFYDATFSNTGFWVGHMAREENMENRALSLKLFHSEVAYITSAHILLSKTRHTAGMCFWKS